MWWHHVQLQECFCCNLPVKITPAQICRRENETGPASLAYVCAMLLTEWEALCSSCGVMCAPRRVKHTCARRFRLHLHIYSWEIAGLQAVNVCFQHNPTQRPLLDNAEKRSEPHLARWYWEARVVDCAFQNILNCSLYSREDKHAFT